MYFILSKLLLLFILPVFWVICLVAYAFYTDNKKCRRILLVVSGLALYMFSIPLFINLWAGVWDSPPSMVKPGKYSCVIILGGFVSERHHGNGFLNNAKHRYFEGINFFNCGVVSHILVTGGNASLIPAYNFSEGEFIRGDIRKRGVPDTAVLIEPHARNTFENAAYSKVILQKAGLRPPYILITSAFHMRRALLIFKKAGIAVIPYPCDLKIKNRSLSLTSFKPAEDNLISWNTYIKELIGYGIAWIKN